MLLLQSLIDTVLDSLMFKKRMAGVLGSRDEHYTEFSNSGSDSDFLSIFIYNFF